MPPRRWTALFFLDEAVALAAGHRPCGQCRHEDYRRFVAAWTDAYGTWPGPTEADRLLHSSRARPGARYLRSHQAKVAELPDGSMFRKRNAMFLKWANGMRPYAPDGYGRPAPLDDEQVEALTSPVMRSILRAGYRPRLHASLATG